LETFGWREPPPIGCGFPHGLEPKILPAARPKSSLTILSISFIFQSSFLAVSNNLTLYLWRIYEIDFPERSDRKAPRGIRKFLWGLSFGQFQR